MAVPTHMLQARRHIYTHAHIHTCTRTHTNTGLFIGPVACAAGVFFSVFYVCTRIIILAITFM